MANSIKKRVFGADVPFQVKQKLEAMQEVGAGVGFGDGELTDDHYVYVCSAGTGNGTTDGTAGIVCVTIDYIGID